MASSENKFASTARPHASSVDVEGSTPSRTVASARVTVMSHAVFSTDAVDDSHADLKGRIAPIGASVAQENSTHASEDGRR